MRGTSGIARIAELVLVGAMVLSACVAPAGAANKPADDHSLDQAEHTRSLAAQAAKPDTSYDQVEGSRARALSGQRARALSGLAAKPDTSYEQAERVRGAAFGQ